MGHHGRLPELSDDSADSGIATSLVASTLKRKSPSPSPTPYKLEIEADVEPMMRDEESLLNITRSIDPDQEWEEQRIRFGQEGSLSLSDSGRFLSLPGHPSRQQAMKEQDTVPDDDEVVTIDGKICKLFGGPPVAMEMSTLVYRKVIDQHFEMHLPILMHFAVFQNHILIYLNIV